MESRPAQVGGGQFLPPGQRFSGNNNGPVISARNSVSQVPYQWRLTGFSTCSQSCAGGKELDSLLIYPVAIDRTAPDETHFAFKESMNRATPRKRGSKLKSQ